MSEETTAPQSSGVKRPGLRLWTKRGLYDRIGDITREAEQDKRDHERIIQALWATLADLNDNWFALADDEKRVRMQNALGLVSDPDRWEEVARGDI